MRTTNQQTRNSNIEPDMMELAEKLAAYENDEAAGRLLRLPCPIGAIVYEVQFAPCRFGETYPEGVSCFRCPGPCDIRKTVYRRKALSADWILSVYGPYEGSVYFMDESDAWSAAERWNRLHGQY